MNSIEAGKICRDSGFNWGRGSFWFIGGFITSGCQPGDVLTRENLEYYKAYPDVTKGATRGVILEWARDKTGYYLSVVPYRQYYGGLIWRTEKTPKVFENCGEERENKNRILTSAETEIECYAKLCQWVKENRNVL